AGLSGPAEPTRTERARLLELRAVLRGLTATLSAGAPLTDADIGGLNRYLATPVARRFGREGLQVIPIRRDWPWAMAEIAASFADLLSSGDPARVKVCSNPECQWAFYDASK